MPEVFLHGLGIVPILQRGRSEAVTEIMEAAVLAKDAVLNV